MSYNSDTSKIDSLATDGLAGVANSLAYRIHEIEKHFHSEEHWYGTDGDGTGSTANNLDEWELTAGTSEAYGTEVQLLGANDVSATDFSFTPAKFDLHRVSVTTSDTNDVNYMVQLWAGTGAFGAATLVTSFPYRAAANNVESLPIDVQMGRQDVATKIWARVRCETNSATLSILVGIHAYVG